MFVEKKGDYLSNWSSRGSSATILFPGYDGAARQALLETSLDYYEYEALR